MGQGVGLLHGCVSLEGPGHGSVELHERVLVQVPFDPVSHVTEQVEKELQSLQPVNSKQCKFQKKSHWAKINFELLSRILGQK